MPQRAVRAALLIRERLRAGGGPSLRLRVGIHTGLALVGNIGAATGSTTRWSATR